MLGHINQIVMELREHLGFLRRGHAARSHSRQRHESGLRRRHARQFALRNFHVDVHAVGKRNVNIHRRGGRAGIAFSDIHVHGLD